MWPGRGRNGQKEDKVDGQMSEIPYLEFYFITRLPKIMKQVCDIVC